uniref:Methyltransferase FkbM domain-containing protein n=1 Tax=Chrysotila carterae TaxID=13221 RepID=A0A7S4B2B7_CHRCT|mmetsp:Transcript_16165/g.34710  ORF Transcript_16165/g.34710 Transcript_16165/m.34710 type:complete len:289 (-) Transcript_16165:499-1365(-)
MICKQLVHMRFAVGNLLVLSSLLPEAASDPLQTASQRGYVVDIGLNQGGDSKMYLALGYDVIAIEANPVLSSKAKLQPDFAVASQQGRFELVEAAIASSTLQNENVTFYVNLVNDEHSSLQKAAGCRRFPKNGYTTSEKNCTEVLVPTTTCDALISKRGIAPVMVKIDIELGDRDCLLQLQSLPRELLPRYISVEAHSPDYVQMLSALGYSQFKIVIQNFFSGNSGPFGEMAMNALCSDRPGGWTHQWCPSGEDITSHWQYGVFSSKTLRMACPTRTGCWFDIHAKRV